MEIGHILKEARIKASMTQEKASEELGVSRQTISNWETGKTFPDIVSVIRMSELYSISLDQLLKGEQEVKKTYLDYLEESTNTVKSNEKKSKVILASVTFGVWALSVIAFWILKDSTDAAGFSMAVSWAVLPILFFSMSFLMGRNDAFGKWKWACVPLFSVMYALTGSVTSIQTEDALYRAVRWPDIFKLPIGVLIAAAGLLLGVLVRKQEAAKQTSVTAE